VDDFSDISGDAAFDERPLQLEDFVEDEAQRATKRSSKPVAVWRLIEIYHEQRELRRLLEDDLL
jgi:hypothetical protein